MGKGGVDAQGRNGTAVGVSGPGGFRCRGSSAVVLEGIERTFEDLGVTVCNGVRID